MPEIKIQEGLEHDCHNCQGFCCVALAIDKKDGFPHNKKMGVACDQLDTNPEHEANLCKCKVFTTLDYKTHSLCKDFTCLGAGNTISEYFKELGIHWAVRPDNISDEQNELRVNNIFNAYLIFHNVFLYLRIIRYQRHPNNKIRYEAARKAVEKVAKDLARTLEVGTQEIKYNDWYQNKFKPEMNFAMHDADNFRLLDKLGMKKWW